MRKQQKWKSILSFMLALTMILSNIQPVLAAEDQLVGALQYDDQTEPETTAESTSEETEPVETGAPETQAPETESTETESETQIATEPETTVETELETGSDESDKKTRQQSSGDDKLTLRVGDSGSGFQDVDSIGNVNTWPLTTSRKQIQIVAEFSDVNLDKERSVEITIPKGYRIYEYSAKTDTPDVDGISRLQLSSENAAKINSISLTDLVGGNWVNQKISGYTQRNSAGEADIRTFNGKVKYVFNNNCDLITLTLTLGLDQSIMPHAVGTAVLDDIKAEMISGGTTLDTTLQTTVSGLTVPTIGSRVEAGFPDEVEANPVPGEVIEFKTYEVFRSYNEIGEQAHIIDSGKIVVNYPEGATFKGFEDNIFGLMQLSDSNGGTYAGGHLEVTNDTAARTVTFDYKKATIGHNSNVRCLWSVDMDAAAGGSWDGSDKELNFNFTFDAASGGGIDKSMNHSPININRVVTVKQPGWDITLHPQNLVRSDLNWNGDYRYDYMLGQIAVVVTGPSTPQNLEYKWEFDPNLAVRAVSFPRGDDTHAIQNVSAIVKNSSGGTRTATADGPFTQIGEAARGVHVTDADLGLAADEYILELTAKQTSLGPGSYGRFYVYGAGSYYGRFQNGNTGTATLTVSHDSGFSVTESDQPVIGWDNTAVGEVYTHASKPGGGSQTWYPGDEVDISSTYVAGEQVYDPNHRNDVVDPDVYISLPEGVNLDLTSVKAVSQAGNHSGAPFTLNLVGTQTKVINGVNWISYHYKTANHQDIIARADNTLNVPYNERTSYIYFKQIYHQLVKHTRRLSHRMWLSGT